MLGNLLHPPCHLLPTLVRNYCAFLWVPLLWDIHRSFLLVAGWGRLNKACSVYCNVTYDFWGCFGLSGISKIWPRLRQISQAKLRSILFPLKGRLKDQRALFPKLKKSALEMRVPKTKLSWKFRTSGEEFLNFRGGSVVIDHGKIWAKATPTNTTPTNGGPSTFHGAVRGHHQPTYPSHGCPLEVYRWGLGGGWEKPTKTQVCFKYVERCSNKVRIFGICKLLRYTFLGQYACSFTCSNIRKHQLHVQMNEWFRFILILFFFEICSIHFDKDGFTSTGWLHILTRSPSLFSPHTSSSHLAGVNWEQTGGNFYSTFET